MEKNADSTDSDQSLSLAPDARELLPQPLCGRKIIISNPQSNAKVAAGAARERRELARARSKSEGRATEVSENDALLVCVVCVFYRAKS